MSHYVATVRRKAAGGRRPLVRGHDDSLTLSTAQSDRSPSRDPDPPPCRASRDRPRQSASRRALGEGGGGGGGGSGGGGGGGDRPVSPALPTRHVMAPILAAVFSALLATGRWPTLCRSSLSYVSVVLGVLFG